MSLGVPWNVLWPLAARLPAFGKLAVPLVAHPGRRVILQSEGRECMPVIPRWILRTCARSRIQVTLAVATAHVVLGRCRGAVIQSSFPSSRADLYRGRISFWCPEGPWIYRSIDDSGREATHGTHNTSLLFCISSSHEPSADQLLLLHSSLYNTERPMKVEIVLDPSKAQSAPTLSQRVGPAPAAAKGAATATQGCVTQCSLAFSHQHTYPTSSALDVARRDLGEVAGGGRKRVSGRQRLPKIWMRRWRCVGSCHCQTSR